MALHDDREALMSGADYDDDYASRSGINAVKSFLAVLLIAGVIGLVWYAYNLGLRKGSESVAPVIQAGDDPVKVAPEDPGGLDVPNQDVAVYEAVEGEEGVERYVPPALPDTGGASSGSGVPTEAPEQATPQDSAEPATSATADEETAAPQVAATPEDDDAAGADEAAPADTVPEAEKSPTADEAPAPEKSPAADEAPAPERQEAAVPDKAPSTAELIGPYRVQLAAYRTPEEAARTWLELEKANKDLLGPLDLIIEKVDLGKDKGVFYRLQAAPLKSREAAESLCGKLKARKVSCIVVQA